MAITFLPNTQFRADVDDAVKAYFQDGRRRRDVPRMYVKSLVLLAWLAAGYLGLVFVAHAWWSAVPFAISIGLAMAGIGMGIQHDAGHGAYSERRLVNRAMSWTLDLLGGSSYFWHYKHNIAHHTYPNITGADDDLVVGKLGRLSPHDPSYRLHRFQHLYMWLLYGCLVVRWHFIDDFHSMIDPGIGQTHVPRPRGWNQVRFWLGKLVFFGLAFVLPAFFHPIPLILGCYAVVAVTLGLVLATVFQLAHCVEEAEFPLPVDGKIQRDWAAHQLDTTVDFARDNRLLTWFVGGLNFQVEHHLFPKICHVHYPAVARIVEDVAARHGVRYRVHAGLRAALRSHYRWLKRMGRPDAVAADQPAAGASPASIERTSAASASSAAAQARATSR